MFVLHWRVVAIEWKIASSMDFSLQYLYVNLMVYPCSSSSSPYLIARQLFPGKCITFTGDTVDKLVWVSFDCNPLLTKGYK